MSQWQRWTPGQDRLLRDAWERGTSARDLEPVLNRTEYAIRKRAERLGIRSNYIERVSGPQTSHGTYARYARGCRCKPCSQANTDYHRSKGYNRRYKARRRQVSEPPVAVPSKRVCSIPGCETVLRRTNSSGVCALHPVGVSA